MANDKNKRLQELGGSDFEIADGQPDIRGWDVKNENDQKIGEVDELIFDVQSLKVRYIVLDLDDNDFDLDDRNVLVPIGIAQLHDKDDDVILPGVTAEQLRLLPEYDEDNLDANAENKIRNVFAGVAGGTLAADSGINHDDTFYDHEHFNEDNLYRNRRGENESSTTIPVIEEELQVDKKEIEKGGIRLRTRVVENRVEEDITLREEKVQVERTPVDRPASADDIKEEEFEVTERAEIPVIAKEARVVEEISLNKEVTEKQETIHDTVKETQVDVEKTDENDDVSTGSNRL